MVTKVKDNLNLFHEMVHSIHQLVHENIYLGFKSFSITGLRMSGAQVFERLLLFCSFFLFSLFILLYPRRLQLRPKGGKFRKRGLERANP